MKQAVPTAVPAKKHQCGGSTPNVGAAKIMLGTTNNQPEINRVQAVIVARALKIGGISPSFWFYSMPAL